MKRKIIKKGLSLLFSNNPKLLIRYLSCYTKERVSRWLLPREPVQKLINGVLFEFDFDLDPRIKRMYLNCYEIEVTEVMRNVLNSGDVFIDVGASIGYLSAVGAGFVGKCGQVHSFEPVPTYFRRLGRLSVLNPDYNMVVNNCALGEKEGTTNIAVTSHQNIGWNTMVPSFMNKKTIKETLEVSVRRLDSYLKERGLVPSLIKIDVEGFEFPVLKGLSGYFGNTNHRPIIICEVAPSAYPLLGFTLSQLSEYMKKQGYTAYSLFKTNAEANITELEKTTNVVFKPAKSQR